MNKFVLVILAVLAVVVIAGGFSSALSFFPLLIMIVIVGVVTLILRAAFNQSFYVGGKITKLILSGYILLLLIGVTVAYATTPYNETAEIEEASETSFQHLYDMAREGKLAEAKDVYQTDQWNFPFEEDRLLISYSGNPKPIFIETKDETDDNVEVIRYSTKFLFDDYEFTELMNSQYIQLEGMTMNIAEGERLELKLAKFHKEFTITQFTGESMFNGESNEFGGRYLLLIKVPKNVTVEAAGNNHLEFVGP